MDITRNFHHTLLLLDHHLVIAARGLYRPTLTEPKLVALLAAGHTAFPFYRFAKFSLERYTHIRISNADISQLLDLPWVLTTFDCTGCWIAADLTGAKLQRVRLLQAVLTGSTFQGADLSGALLNGADCQGVNFSYAILHEVNAVETKFDRAQFHEAVSRGGNFHQASFHGAATDRFFVTSAVGIPSRSRYLGASSDRNEPGRLSKAQRNKRRSTFGIALGRMSTMIDDFYQDLPKMTKLLIDMVIFLGLLLAFLKFREAHSSEEQVLKQLGGGTGNTAMFVTQQQQQDRQELLSPEEQEQ